MDFTHGDDRRMLADTIGRYVVERYGIAERNEVAYGEKGYSPEHWRELAELGIVAALFDEAAGGFGGSGFDIAVVFEALGRGLVVEPFASALMAGRALAAAGRQDAVLARIVAGETIVAFAHEDDETRGATRATRDGTGWRIDGVKSVVAQAEAATLLLVSAAGEGDAVSLFLVRADAPGVAVRGYSNIDGGRSGEVTLDAVRVADDALVGPEGEGRALVDEAVAAGLLGLCAEAVGVMDAIKDLTVDYLRTRVQFGVPIGKFQALQHRMATLLIEIEQARSAVINAAAAFDGDDRSVRDRVLAAAKYTIGRAGTLVAEEAIQMHGGIGMTWELPLSHYAKRLTMIDHQLGDEDHHLQRYIALQAA